MTAPTSLDFAILMKQLEMKNVPICYECMNYDYDHVMIYELSIGLGQRQYPLSLIRVADLHEFCPKHRKKRTSSHRFLLSKFETFFETNLNFETHSKTFEVTRTNTRNTAVLWQA